MSGRRSEADDFIAELDGVHELRTRVAELEGQLRTADANAAETDQTIGGLLRELSDLRNEHKDAVKHLHVAKMMLAKANSELVKLRAAAGQGGVETRRGW